MKRNQEITVKIDRFRFPNKGIGNVEGKPVVIKHALPGETVLARVKRTRAEKAEAKPIRVLESAPHHVTPPCRHYDDCGGCQRQQLIYEDQLALKSDAVRELLGWDAQVYDGIVPSPSVFHYRNKMEYSFGDAEKEGPMTLGMHRRGRFMDVINTDHCLIVHEDFNRIQEATLRFFEERNVKQYHRKKHEGILRHLVVRRGEKTGQLLVGLSVSDPHAIDTEAYKKCLLDLNLDHEIVGILLLVNEDLGDVVKDGDVRVIHGRDFYEEELFDLTFRVSFFSFFQTNTSGAERLYAEAIGLLDDHHDQVIYDLYSGTGTIAQVLAKSARHVYGVEIVADAVAAAKENARLNALDNVTFLAGDVFETLPAIEEKPDLIVVDPPRVGLGQKAASRVAAYGVPQILYISCNPITLKEDLETMAEAGYRVKRAKTVDLFPHTYHVESIALLEREDIKG